MKYSPLKHTSSIVVSLHPGGRLDFSSAYAPDAATESFVLQERATHSGQKHKRRYTDSHRAAHERGTLGLLMFM